MRFGFTVLARVIQRSIGVSGLTWALWLRCRVEMLIRRCSVVSRSISGRRRDDDDSLLGALVALLDLVDDLSLIHRGCAT